MPITFQTVKLVDYRDIPPQSGSIRRSKDDENTMVIVVSPELDPKRWSQSPYLNDVVPRAIHLGKIARPTFT